MMKLKKILALTLSLACFLSPSAFADSAVSASTVSEGLNSSTTQEPAMSDEWDCALQDLEELSSDDILLLAQTNPVDFYENNGEQVVEISDVVEPATVIDSASTAIAEEVTFQETWSTYDYDTVPDWAKENVLIARSSIVYSGDVSWTENVVAKIMNEDGSLEAVPEYSDVFPYWDLEQIYDYNIEMQLSSVSVNNIDESATPSAIWNDRFPIFTNRKYSIFAPNSGYYECTINAGLFYRSVGVWATSIPGDTYNIGGTVFATATKPSSDQYSVYLRAGQGLRIYNIANRSIMYRFSSYSKTGSATFSADYEQI